MSREELLARLVALLVRMRLHKWRTRKWEVSVATLIAGALFVAIADVLLWIWNGGKP